MAIPCPSTTIPILSFLTIFAVFASSGVHAEYVLYNGEALTAGQNLTNWPFHLSMHKDCSLVLYDKGKPTWKANITTHHRRNQGKHCYLGLKQTGELIIRDDIHYTLWSSGARSKRGKYALVLNKSGGLHIYGTRRWVSNNQKEMSRPELSTVPVSTEYTLHSGDKLNLGRKLAYRDYELSLDKCNLAIHNTVTRKILWQTNTKSVGCYLQLEENGVLNLKRNNNQKIWSSKKKGDDGKYVAVLRFDGRLAVYGPVLWSNHNSTVSDQGSYEAF